MFTHRAYTSCVASLPVSAATAWITVMWSETVGLRTRPVSYQKIGLGLGLGLAGLVLCCKTRSCHARRHKDLEGHGNFSSTIYSFSILCSEQHYCMWRSTVVFTYLKVKFAKCLCLFGLKNLALFTSLMDNVNYGVVVP